MFFATPVYAATGEAGTESGGALFSIFGLEVSSAIFTMWILMAVLSLLAYFTTRHLEKIPHSRLQNAMELSIETILGLLASMMGSEEKAKKFFPLLGSFFILILASNYSGLIPGVGHLPGLKAPTSTLSVTVAFALIVFVATHFYGIKAKGLKYFKHFIDPFPIMLPLNIIEEFVRPLSLSLRLFGNVFGEEMVVASILSFAPWFFPIPMMVLGVLFGLIQAFVFTMLATFYIANATAEHH